MSWRWSGGGSGWGEFFLKNPSPYKKDKHNMTKNSKWREIISADDDVIETEMLDWSGLHEAWQKSQLNQSLNFINDIVEHCRHASVEKEIWGGDEPGRSGVWHVIKTDNEIEFKRELKLLVQARVRELNSSPVISNIHSAQGEVREVIPKKELLWDYKSICFVHKPDGLSLRMASIGGKFVLLITALRPDDSQVVKTIFVKIGKRLRNLNAYNTVSEFETKSLPVFRWVSAEESLIDLVNGVWLLDQVKTVIFDLAN